ncbi:MAG: ABC transporter ATP-binding protein [Thermoleophilaceae bacterium]
MLVVDRLVKHYPSGGGEVARALDGACLTIEPGQLVALYGPSGSGKTTLLNIVAALLQPDSGTVTVNGHLISALSRRDADRYRRMQLGYISQSPDLLPGVRAIDNAALKLLGTRASPAEARRHVAPLLERLGLESRLQHRPHELSAGQRQRVLIARALSTSPRLVLADEPTGNLDARHSHDVLRLLTEICAEQRVAMLLVTHDPQAAAFATRVQALEGGRIAPFEPPGLSVALDR